MVPKTQLLPKRALSLIALFLYLLYVLLCMLHEAWYVEILQSGSEYAVLCMCLLMVGIFLRTRESMKFFAFYFFIVFVCSIPILSITFQRLKDETVSGHLGSTHTLMTANVYSQNNKFELLFKEVERVRPDFLVVVEVTPLWMRNLEQRFSYPFVGAVPRDDNFGIAVLSKCPMIPINVENETPVPLLTFKINCVGFQSFLLSAIHLYPPGDSESYDINRRIISELVQRVHPFSDLPHLVAGDLNSTPYGTMFHLVKNSLNLKDIQRTFMRPRTWSAYSNFLRFSLDHILFSQGLEVSFLERGDDIGSDHFPLYTQFVLENRSNNESSRLF